MRILEKIFTKLYKPNEFEVKLFGIYRPFWKIMLLLGIIMLIAQAINATIPFFFGKLIHTISSGGTIKVAIFFAFALFIVDDVLGNFIELLSSKIEIFKFNFDVGRKVKEESNLKLLELSIGQHLEENSGKKRDIISRGSENVHQFIKLCLYQALPSFFYILCATIFLFYLNIWLGLITTISSSIYLLCLLKINKKLQEANKEIEEARVEMNNEQSELLRNISTIISNAKGEKALSYYMKFLDKWIIKGKPFWMRFNKMECYGRLLHGFLFSISIVIGILLIEYGNFDTAEFISFIFWSNNIHGKMNYFKQIARSWTEIKASLEKYIEMMDTEPRVKMPENPIMPENITGEIRFDQVSFKHQRRNGNKATKKRDTLLNISFCIAPGEKVAIIGESGSGKSTILNLLQRAYDPQSGKILIDGIDLKEIDLDFYLKKVGLVEQEVILFDRSLLENITFAMSEEDETKRGLMIREAIEISQISKFLPDLEDGLDTIVGERGVWLSGGQKQRVGIARAIAKEPAILCLDEATSSLDAITRVKIHQAMEDAAKGRTTIIVAHDLSAIKKVDRIIVLDKGEIIAQGTHQELAETCKLYQELVKFNSL